MNIYIMRHGEAGYHAASDAERPLTDFGRQQSVAVAEWLDAQQVSFDFVLCSPYLRARQTLTAVNSIIKSPNVEWCDNLTPGGNAALVSDYLLSLQAKGYTSLFVVSHLPLVGYLVNQLCPTVAPPMFSTASLACVSLNESEQGTLQWMHRAN